MTGHMKKTSSSLMAPPILSALFWIIGVGLALVAVNLSVFYNGSWGTIRAQGSGIIPPAPQDPGPPIGYENFAAPGVLVPVTTTEAGQQVNSVEWMGRNGGEPSL